jgi:prepilin-type N-terminal cleavage/methylation domain-containing protein
MCQVLKAGRRQHKAAAGLTFIELLVVISIIGITAGLSLPRLRNAFANFALESFVKDLYYLSCYLQTSAIASGNIYYLNIDSQQGSFQAASQQEDGPRAISGRFGRLYQAPEAVLVLVDPPEKKAVRFYPDGSTEKITVSFQNQQKRKISLVIKGAAGEIKVQEGIYPVRD